MLELLITTIGGLLVGGGGVWLYYRTKFTEVLTELEDKKLIIKTIHQHADEIERQNVKKMAKEHNAKVAKKTKVEKVVEKPKRKYKKSNV
jgi:hypothetical protein